MNTDLLEYLRCPVSGCALRQGEEASTLVPVTGSECYPLVDGVPVLVADQAERNRIATVDWQGGETGASAADFYNQTRDLETFLANDRPEHRPALSRFLGSAPAKGLVLEIGSGKGAFQNIGQPYVAVDYSLTALRRYINPEIGRICASAEQLPLKDSTVRFCFTIMCLEHVPRADLAMAEIDRVLLPGGIAYIAPAWHCVQYNCEGISVRPWSELSFRQRLIKATLPLRRNRVLKAICSLPRRTVRRLQWMATRRPMPMPVHRLRPDYAHFWLSDSDATSRLDSHDGCLYFASRGYEILQPAGSTLKQVCAGHIALVVRKPT